MKVTYNCKIFSKIQTKSTLTNPSTISTTTTTSVIPQTEDSSTYYPILETKTEVTFFPDTSEEILIPSTDVKSDKNKEPRTLKVETGQVRASMKT